MLNAMNFLSKKQSLCKRGMDLFLSLLFLPFLIVPILVLIIGASIDTQQFGLFFQKRVGQHGVLFTIYKIRTHQITGNISKYSKKIRKLKFDELPQIVNVLLGQMSFVGPRPDLPEIIATLKESDRIILSLKPGLTGPASLWSFNEEALLAEQNHPSEYNVSVLFPAKTVLNVNYLKKYHLLNDLKYIYKTLQHVFQNMAF
jgi:lipopolysaccharide/colanic/teichoic acid biosynthesis glycosyltransferase